MLLDFIMMRARIWDRQRRYVRIWAKEPDTSDIPEVSEEWFKTAKWSDGNDHAQRVPDAPISGDTGRNSGTGAGGSSEPPTREQD